MVRAGASDRAGQKQTELCLAFVEGYRMVHACWPPRRRRLSRRVADATASTAEKSVTRSIIVEPASVTNAQVSRVASMRSCQRATNALRDADELRSRTTPCDGAPCPPARGRKYKRRRHLSHANMYISLTKIRFFSYLTSYLTPSYLIFTVAPPREIARAAAWRSHANQRRPPTGPWPCRAARKTPF